MSSYSDLLARIVIDAKLYRCQPCIKGHQISVSSILHQLAEGMTVEEILEEQYPNLEREDILACFAYAAEMTQDINKVVGTVVEIEKGAILEYQSRERD